MNVGEYGIAFNLNVNYDISGFETLSIAFARPDSTGFAVTNPAVSVGTQSITTPVGTFAANQYAVYTIANGDITVPGTYTARLTYTDSTKRLISSVVTFLVSP